MVPIEEERSDGGRNMVHVHAYITEADVADEHQHMVMSISAPAIEEGNSHIHRLRVRTSFYAYETEGHWHWLDVMTDVAVDMPCGTHVHYFCGPTSTDDGHCHNVQGVTGAAPEEEESDDEEDEVHHHHHCKTRTQKNYMECES